MTNWKLADVAKNYNMLQAQRWLAQMYPVEQHSAGGDCVNPKCDYEFTAQDEAEMAQNHGWFTCPQCDLTYNYLDMEPGVRYNRVGMSPGQMGQIGEDVVEQMGTIPLLGTISYISRDVQYPIDLIAGPFGVEVKTNHSEAQPRFKLGGSKGQYGLRQGDASTKLQFCEEHGLRPALVGVRLNFYTDKADVFVRQDSFTDTWIGSAALQHVATEDFTSLNPFKDPSQVPPPSELPEDDDPDSDIPF